VHPAVVSRRVRELLLMGLTGVVPLVIALGIAREVPNPSIPLTFGAILVALGIIVLVVSTRYEVTFALIALYLGLLEGPVKLMNGESSVTSVSRDIFICAISLGALLRLAVKKERVRLPPMSGWALAFVALVLIEAFNPGTHGIVKVLGGIRQQLEWIPFFFFGYLLIRSKERFRKLFLVLGVIALANGVVGVYQSRLSPGELASWGAGYAELAEGGGNKGQSSFAYTSGGVARIRPPGLGSTAGFGGAVGVLALPAILALLATLRTRRRWFVPVLLSLGALAGIATSASRTAVLGAVAAMLGFALLSSSAGRRARRPLVAVLVVTGLAVGIGAVLASAEGTGIFSRFASIATPEQAAQSSVGSKGATLRQIPADVVNAPFGVGLATVAAAAGFGGDTKVKIEEHEASAESQYNTVVLELGALGLLLWIALTVKLTAMAVRGLRRVRDMELRIDLVAVFATLFAITIMGFSGPTTTSSPAGPLFWLGAGIAAYWLAGPGRKAFPTIRAGAS
jgi:hypothetical protein